jgi:hypothetical protein
MSMSDPVGLPAASKNSSGGYGMSEQITSLPGRMSWSGGTVAMAAAEALGATEADAAALAGALGVAVAGVVVTADVLGLELVVEQAASEIATVINTVERIQRRMRPSS